MHIPDGYLSPATCGAFYAVMLPLWYRATKRVKKIVKSQYVPLIAVGAAFSFLVMMFNIPVPDGTTAHAVGAVMIAIVLGPWAAVIAVSIALGIQALFFGDGGVLALGANAFNMAFVMPFVGFAVYRLLTRNMSLTSSLRAVMAGVAGYVGIVAGALCAAVEFGLQPELFHTANGTPLYAPFHLSQTIPAMLHRASDGGRRCGVHLLLRRGDLPPARERTHPSHQPSRRAGDGRRRCSGRSR